LDGFILTTPFVAWIIWLTNGGIFGWQ
jgi:hypothetical protein